MQVLHIKLNCKSITVDCFIGMNTHNNVMWLHSNAYKFSIQPLYLIALEAKHCNSITNSGTYVAAYFCYVYIHAHSLL